MSPTFARAVLLVLVVTFPLAAEDKPPALQRTGEAVSATPQTLAERAKTMRVNRAVFDDFRPPQVIFDPGSTSKSAPPPATSSGNLPGASSGPPQSQPRRINPLGEYFNAKANAEATQRCPSSTEGA